ncbi:MAG: RNA-binding transcriptional accessory protein, partial [Spirochaetia bacterium]|nr:RNA-binding transcriptional accessory protein [Spirochaetia bacterium]
MELDQEFIDGLSVNSTAIVDRIADELKVRPAQVKAVVDLLAEGCTVPFISRYRKERTGELDEVQVRDVSHLSVSYVNLETRRIEVVKSIHAQGKLDATLYRNIMKCATLVEIEDIY